MSKQHQTHTWTQQAKARKAIAAANNEPCCRCGQPIDYTLDGRTRNGPTIDHRQPVAHTGTTQVNDPLTDLAPAHRHCNSRHGQRLSAAKRRRRPQPATKISDTPPAPTPTVISVYTPGRSGTPGVGSSGVSGVPAPRFMSGSHPLAVGSLGREAIEWIRARRLADDVVPDGEKDPVPAWELILDRALEVDGSGRLVWPIVVLTVPRQSTKSTLLAELLAWRIHQSDRWGERQVAVHTANKLQSAGRVQEDFRPWARAAGLGVGLRTGQERITHPDSSRWEISSLRAVYGARASFAVVDEAFEVERAPVEKGILPTMARRVSPQCWLVSTANDSPTGLMTHYMGQARAGSDRVCLIDWGLRPGADPGDEANWWVSNPFPTSGYVDRVRAHSGDVDWLAQWLNVWPLLERPVETWLPADVVGGCGREVVRLGGVVVAGVEQDRDGQWCVVAGDESGVLCRRGGSEVLGWLGGLNPELVLAHEAVVQQLGGLGLRLERVNQAQVAAAGALLREQVLAGEIVWDEPELVARQFGDVVVVPTDGGVRVVAGKSRGPVGLVKAMSWVVWWCRSQRGESPQVW